MIRAMHVWIQILLLQLSNCGSLDEFPTPPGPTFLSSNKGLCKDNEKPMHKSVFLGKRDTINSH